ncbi:MAG: sensor histidine kinase, partial [Gammaproteobacteria bacterium]
PMRQALLLRLTRGETGPEEALSDVLALALVAEPEERGAEWRELLHTRFQPARITPEDASGTTRVLDDGLGLLVPAHNGCPGLRLHLRDAGRSLFRRADAELVDTLVKLLAQTLVRRTALDEATQAERQRIAQDLHDDLGSRLLMMIHRSEQPELATLAREAMADLRTILSAIDGPGVSLAGLLADCRAETAQRCEASGTRLGWNVEGEIPDTWLSSQLRSTLSRCLRELVTNALKHAQPESLSVTVNAQERRLRIRLAHPLADRTAQEWQSGRGLHGVNRRVESLHGRFAIERSPGESITAILEVPL